MEHHNIKAVVVSAIQQVSFIAITFYYCRIGTDYSVFIVFLGNHSDLILN